jgi:hypothetical protein
MNLPKTIVMDIKLLEISDGFESLMFPSLDNQLVIG